MIAILAVGLSALELGEISLSAAKDDRVSSRMAMVQSLGPKLGEAQAAEELQTTIDLAGFVRGDAASYQSGLSRFRVDSSGDKPRVVALLGLDGQPLATVPADASLDVAAFGPAWSAAVQGANANTPLFQDNDTMSIATLVPIGGDQEWAVLVIVKGTLGSLSQELVARLGSLNTRPGGLTLVDHNGLAINSWDASNVGRLHLAPETVAELPVGTATMWTTDRNGTHMTMIGMALPNGYSLVYEQATDALFEDLEAAQHGRDVTSLAVMAVALAGLVLFQLARERTVRRAEARSRALLENSQDLVLVADSNGTIAFVSPAIGALLGFSTDAWLRRPLTTLCHADDVTRVDTLLADPDAPTLLNVRLCAADGGYRWFDIEATDHSAHADLGGILLTCHDVGQRKTLQDELTRQATHDNLTGLPNRAELSTRLDALVAEGRPVRPFALLYVDLDHFKPINDTLGHDAGDRVLAIVAQRFRDAAGPKGFVARLGGDEFGVLLDGADQAEAYAAANRLRTAACAPIPVGTSLARVDTSIGIALADPAVPLDHTDLLVRQADQAMYRAKHQGRGRWTVVAHEEAPAPSGLADARDRQPAGREVGTAGPDDEPMRSVKHTATVAPAPTPTRTRRWSSVVPLLAALAVVAAVAGVGRAQTEASMRAAENERLAARLDVTVGGAEFYSRQFDTSRLVVLISDLPWTLDGSAMDALIVDGLADSFAMVKDPDIIVTLATPDGRVLTSVPTDAGLTTTADTPAWRAALAGRGSAVPYLEVNGVARTQLVFPVMQGDTAEAIIVVDVPIREGLVQRLLVQKGSIGLDSGGWSLTDSNGVVTASWNEDLLGHKIADPTFLAGANADKGSSTISDSRVVAAAPMPSMSSPAPVYLVYTEPTEEFFHDLRLGQGQRDGALLIVLIAAVIGLAIVSRRREQAIRRSERRLDALVQHAHDVAMVLDQDLRATFVSSAITGLLGYPPDAYVGHPLSDLVHPDDRERYNEFVSTARPRVATSMSDVRLLHRDGEYRWFDLDAIDLSAHREVGGVLLSCHEVGERKAFQDQLTYRARHDALTGLANRAVFAERLERLADVALTQPFAVLFIDLDHFKPINDTLGHDAGDEVLRTVADRLTTSVRSGNDDRSPDMVCRLGGDEFAVLLLDVTEDRARMTAERILSVVREPIPVKGTAVEVSATIGVSLSHVGLAHPDIAVREADSAMYEAKQAGRNCYAMAEHTD